ncbi:MAG TPA: UDP-3-O-(3-hydroxymyristoyl)glucosamine N-acyltransferase [Caldithrix abyssi]|uniref:UDP-3-O-acylglucosamine N-acyltransferase n=1 Tax=Caldithrix abyssi TaxID=187145 RepID=A0A7V5RQ57_CALAY|nr:UDP-3-O-(3-hydroxymyristoyl)glucosamine N-acyltransferase [Caldithrix abyssi]
MRMTLSEIAQLINGELHGAGDVLISGPAKIEEAGDGEISFISSKKYKHFLDSTRAAALIVDQEYDNLKTPHIRVKDAYVGFLYVLKAYAPEKTHSFEGISPKAHIEKSATIGEDCAIAPLVFVGENCRIGKRCVLHPGVVLSGHVTVGDDCILYPNVSVRENCVIGNRVIIHNGSVIGSDGFGFAPQKDKYIKIPQIGHVVIGDDVELGANVTIDRATMGTTVIEKGVKLDNLVQVAHNCIIGAHTVIAAQSGVAGSTKVGRHVTVAGQVGINGHITVGDNNIIGAKSGVTKSTKNDEILLGMPAVPMMQKKRIDVSLKHLPDTMKKINNLENEIIELRELIEKIHGR